MARRRVLELIVLTLALTALYLLQLGCEGIEQPEPDKNKEPETAVTSGPVDSSDAFYRVHLFWKGFDTDGMIRGFEYAVDDTSRNELWIPTVKTDSVFVFNTATDGSQLQRRYHRYFVRAIDNEGKEDPSPAVIEFFAETEAAPRSILLADTANRMVVIGTKVYLAGGENGLDVFDLGGGDVDRVTTYFTGGYAGDIVIDDGYLFMADGSRGVVVFDVADPAMPALVARYETLGEARALDYDSPYLFVADGMNGIVVLDVSVPEDPVFFARYRPTPALEFVGVEAEGDLVFGAAGMRGIVVLQFRPEKSELILLPVPEGSAAPVVTGEEVFDFDSFEDYLYVANGEGGLSTYRVEPDGALAALSSNELQGRAIQVKVRNGHLYVANSFNGICVLDIADPADPKSCSHVGFSGNITGICFSGDTLIAGNGDRGLRFLDASDPTNVTLLGLDHTSFCPESPAEAETLLAFSSVKFCWTGVSPGGQVIAYRYQLQGIDNEPVQVSPESTEVFYRNLPPKDEYLFAVETKDETGLWSAGEEKAERRFTVNFDPESYLDTLWVTGPYTDAGPIPLTAADTLLPDSTFIHFCWHHSDKDTVQSDSVVGSWWRVGGAGFFSADSLESTMVACDVAGPLVSSPPSGYILEVGGIDSFGRRERFGARFNFQVNFPPDVQIVSPVVNSDLIAPDSVTITLQGLDVDGPPQNLLYEYEFRTTSNQFLDDGNISGLFGSPGGVIQFRVATFGIRDRVVFEVTPLDRQGRGKAGPTRTVRFRVRPQ